MLVKYGLLGCSPIPLYHKRYAFTPSFGRPVLLISCPSVPTMTVSYHCSPAVSLLVMQLPIELSFALRFPSTVSLNLSFGLPVSREPLRSLEYRICLGCYSFSILRTCSDHLRFLCIRMSDSSCGFS